MIVGLIKPTAGSVNVFGMDLKDNYWPIMQKLEQLSSPRLSTPI